MFNVRKTSIALAILLAISGYSYAISFNRIIYPIKVIDASGYELKQYQAPQRIVSGVPYITEILYQFNSSDRIVGITERSNYPEGVKDLSKIGRDKLDIKKVIKATPDLVIVPYVQYKDDLEGLRKLRFTVKVSDETMASEEVREITLEVFAVDPISMKDILDNIDTIGTITNRQHAAYSLKERMKRKLAWVEARAKNEKNFRKLRAMVITSKRPLTAAGQGTYLNDLMDLAGLIDVTPVSNNKYVKLSREDIKKANPDILITSTFVARRPKDIYNNRGFRKISAGKNKMALCIEDEIFSRPGPRITEVLEQIAEFTYGWKVKNEQTK